MSACASLAAPHAFLCSATLDELRAQQLPLRVRSQHDRNRKNHPSPRPYYSPHECFFIIRGHAHKNILFQQPQMFSLSPRSLHHTIYRPVSKCLCLLLPFHLAQSLLSAAVASSATTSSRNSLTTHLAHPSLL